MLYTASSRYDTYNYLSVELLIEAGARVDAKNWVSGFLSLFSFLWEGSELFECFVCPSFFCSSSHQTS